MQTSGKVIVASQHYPPDSSTTAAIMATIANHLARTFDVVVLSGTAGSAVGVSRDQPQVVQVKNSMPAKAALVRRAMAELLFTARTFLALVARLKRGDVVLTVTAPFTLPYGVAAAARLRRAQSVLILHDLFPDVLVMSGLLKPKSVVAMAIRGINTLMFRALNAVVIIGRDSEKLLLGYAGMTCEKIRFIPNWTTLAPGIRAVQPDNPFRRTLDASFVVGLSGNLGFTHDPEIVFEAARRLQDERDIHFLLSGWGIGFKRLKQMQAESCLPNVTFVERVEHNNLEALLSAADVWLIPYRKCAAGVSVPSRFYNLLAVGRPVILVSEPEAEAALTVTENNLGWVVLPGMPDQLADVIRSASRSPDPSVGERAVAVARNYSQDRALSGYAALVQGLLANPQELMS